MHASHIIYLVHGACHILTYYSSLKFTPLNPDVTNFESHSFKISVAHPLPFIIYVPSVCHICLVSAQNSHTVTRPVLPSKNIIAHLLITSSIIISGITT